jgi:hypothetical protein
LYILSKTKQKNRSEHEVLRGYIRELEKQIRALRSQVKSYEKYDRSQDEEQYNDTEDTAPNLKFTKDCDNCGKGKLVETFTFGNNTYGTCGHCGHSGKIN